MLVQLKSAEFRYGNVTIFKDVNLDVNEGDNIGIVGANGAGKSTLLSCIMGEHQLFDGDIYRKNNMVMGIMKQNGSCNSSKTVYGELLNVFSREIKLVKEIDEVSQAISKTDSASAEYKRLAERYHRLCVQADVSEAYDVNVKVNTVINGMGLTAFKDRVVSTLSGGEKTKVALCRLLLCQPDLLVLDEPTNHLDYRALSWLESFLANSKITLLVVSHDRYFLDKLCTSIWDVQHQQVICYKGNYTKYKTLKAERLLNEQREYEKQQKEIAKLTDYIARNKVRASTADMAKSREKTLEKMTVLDAPKKDERPPKFRFEKGSDPSEFPLTIKNLTLGFGDRILLDGAELQIKRGEKVALLGLNGVGKSTLIKRIAANNPQDLGKIIFGKNVKTGYYDQENLNLQKDLSVLNQLWFDNTRMSQTEVRNLLAQVTLGADDVYKEVGDLSGGERAKLGLAMIMAKPCNLLLLDEPTNHLDLPSREALEDALKQYDGTLLFVSHDRYFVNGLATKIAEIEGGKINVYQGGYEQFAERKIPAPVKEKKKAETAYRNAKQRAEQTNKAKKLKELEQSVTALEREIASLNEQASNPQITGDYAKLQPVLQRLEQANAELEQAMLEWESLADE